MNHFLILGKACSRRQDEIAMVRRFFLANGWQETVDVPAADAVVLFACAGVRSIVEENLRAIRDVQANLRPGAELIVGSCLPAIDGPRLATVFRGRTISPTDFTALNGLPGISLPIQTMPALWGPDAACLDVARPTRARALRMRLDAVAFEALRRAIGLWPAPALRRVAFRLKQRNAVGFSVAAGCPRKCAYCARPTASGAVRSRPPDVVLENIRHGVGLGYGTFNLFADSIGAYGLDLHVTLGDLLDRIAGLDGRFTVGLYDVHTDDFLRFFDPIDRLCEAGKLHYLYVAVQSGSERVLRTMRRPCDVELLADRLVRIRRHRSVFMQSAIIIGFPGETDDEFDDTLRLLTRVGFDHVYVHCYCDMPGTEASRLSAKVDKETMRQRLQDTARAAIVHDARESHRECEMA